MREMLVMPVRTPLPSSCRRRPRLDTKFIEQRRIDLIVLDAFVKVDFCFTFDLCVVLP